MVLSNQGIRMMTLFCHGLEMQARLETSKMTQQEIVG